MLGLWLRSVALLRDASRIVRQPRSTRRPTMLARSPRPNVTPLRRGRFGAIPKRQRAGSLRLAAQDVALSRRKQGFESPRERQ